MSNEQQPDFNEFLASMANGNDFNNLMSGLTNTMNQMNTQQSENKIEECEKKDNEENEESDDEEYDELLYNLLTNENEEPFPNILSRIETNLNNLTEEFKKHNEMMKNISNHFINK
tara:strand:- start:940 stop:1287 length:348 start_codon:yes stop_codon:yes gene_type:complete